MTGSCVIPGVLDGRKDEKRVDMATPSPGGTRGRRKQAKPQRKGRITRLFFIFRVPIAAFRRLILHLFYLFGVCFVKLAFTTHLAVEKLHKKPVRGTLRHMCLFGTGAPSLRGWGYTFCLRGCSTRQWLKSTFNLNEGIIN